jgi:hypothetical protein
MRLAHSIRAGYDGRFVVQPLPFNEVVTWRAKRYQIIEMVWPALIARYDVVRCQPFAIGFVNSTPHTSVVVSAQAFAPQRFPLRGLPPIFSVPPVRVHVEPPLVRAIASGIASDLHQV